MTGMLQSALEGQLLHVEVYVALALVIFRCDAHNL